MWVEPISNRHTLEEFTCGSKRMDQWLQRHALANEAIGASRTYILTDDGVRVVGYYTLTAASVERSDLPAPLREELPPVSVPGYLLGRLAVALTDQGAGRGTDLLVDAARIALEACKTVGGAFIVVDPIDERARMFYARRGFVPVEGDAGGRMYISMAAVRAAFESAGDDDA